ncbi:MAG: hypothetical protein WCI17_10860, partial [bacterium]
LQQFSIWAASAAHIENCWSRYICGGSAHPDHDTICAFRVQNANLFQDFRRLARLIPAATTRCHGDLVLQTA